MMFLGLEQSHMQVSWSDFDTSRVEGLRKNCSRSKPVSDRVRPYSCKPMLIFGYLCELECALRI